MVAEVKTMKEWKYSIVTALLTGGVVIVGLQACPPPPAAVPKGICYDDTTCTTRLANNLVYSFTKTYPL